MSEVITLVVTAIALRVSGKLVSTASKAMGEALQESAQQACRSIGFQRITASAGVIRAEDGSGRALLVEIGKGGDLRAELLGTASPECRQVIDRFLEALRSHGVEWEGVDRRWKGGIPTTEVGQRWVQEQFETPPSGGSETNTRKRRSTRATRSAVRIRR